MVTMYKILTDIEEGQRKVRNMAQTVGRHLRRLGFGLVQRLYVCYVGVTTCCKGHLN